MRKITPFMRTSEVCMDWILDFLKLDSGYFHRDQEWGFLSVVESGLDLGFVFTEKNVTGCLLDLYLPGLKQESDCLNLIGTGSGLDSDSQFAKQDWIRTQKNQSPNTSSAHGVKSGIFTYFDSGSGVKRNFWPLRNFWPIIVFQLFCFSE